MRADSPTSRFGHISAALHPSKLPLRSFSSHIKLKNNQGLAKGCLAKIRSSPAQGGADREERGQWHCKGHSRPHDGTQTISRINQHFAPSSFLAADNPEVRSSAFHPPAHFLFRGPTLPQSQEEEEEEEGAGEGAGGGGGCGGGKDEEWVKGKDGGGSCT